MPACEHPKEGLSHARVDSVVRAAVVGAIVALVTLVSACGASTKTAAAALDPADVAAARACEAFSAYLGDAANGTVPQKAGRALVSAAGVLVQGAQQDEKLDRPLPKWLRLGANMLAAAQDVVKGDSGGLQKDGSAVAADCHSIPPAAQVAGGYVKKGS